MWLRVTGDWDVIEGYPTPRSSRGGVDLVKPSAHGCPVIRRPSSCRVLADSRPSAAGHEVVPRHVAAASGPFFLTGLGMLGLTTATQVFSKIITSYDTFCFFHARTHSVHGAVLRQSLVLPALS